MSSTEEPYYPVNDGGGLTILQSRLRFELMDRFDSYFAAHPRDVLVGSCQLIYYRRGDPSACVAPELYIFENAGIPAIQVTNWKTWEHGGKAPTLALEILTHAPEYHKEYVDHILPCYEELGVRELICYDPEVHAHDSEHVFSHHVRNAHGRLTPQSAIPGRVHANSFGFWLIAQPDGGLQLATDTLWSTPAERLAEVRAENQRLRAELARLRGE